LLESNQYFILKRITIEGESAFGLPMLKYLDVFDTLMTPYPVSLHKGFMIIPYESTIFLTTFIQRFAEQKIYRLYEKAELDVSITRKIKLIVEKIKGEVIKSQKISVNIKKHFIPKELLEEQERVKDVERANRIIDQLENLSKEKLMEHIEGIEIKAFPPCVNVVLDKIINKKGKLSHNENILLCTYLGKKHFDIDQVKKIFSKAVNYDKGTTDYQVTFLYEKKMMPMNCTNLGTEGICKMNLDKTNQCGHIKNPLSFR
jgi:DNA primase large subunit